MGQLKWYKRDPDAALSGMMGLTLEERGAYNTVLDLIYTRDGKLPDDERFVSGWLGVDVRVWRRIKTRLIDLEKLSVRNGNIHNTRADAEVLAALSRVGSAQDAGRASARARTGKSELKNTENNDLGVTDVPTDDGTPVGTNHNHNHKEDKEEEAKASPSQRANVLRDFPKPDWADAQVWSDFLRNRKTKKATNTPTAYRQFISSIEQFASDEWPPGRLLAHAAARGWAIIVDPKEYRNGRPQPAPTTAPSGRAMGRTEAAGRAAAERVIAAQQARPPTGGGSHLALVEMPDPLRANWNDP